MRDEIMQLRPEKTFFKYLTQPPGSLMHFHIFSSKQKLCIEMIILQWKNGRKLQELLKHNVGSGSHTPVPSFLMVESVITQSSAIQSSGAI